MDSKDLMSLISEDVRELSLLCSGISEMESVPSSVLCLAKGKVSSLMQRIELLENYQNASSAQANEKAEKPVVEATPSKVESDEVKTAQDEIKTSRVVETVPPVVTKADEPTAKEERSTAVEKKEPEKVVDKVEYQANVEQYHQGEGKSLVNHKSDVVPCEKHDTVVSAENKSHGHDFGSVRTVLDANRSTKRVESRFVQSLKRAITLNDRIRYMNELFGGDAELMSSTIAALDGMSSLKEAKDYVKWNFSWDEEDEAASDFMRLLEDRFS